jgi:hypothetical protein
MKSSISFEDLKIGQHAWVIADEKLLLVAKFNNDRFDVCGAWECGISPSECKIVKLVNVPKKHKNTPLYY